MDDEHIEFDQLVRLIGELEREADLTSYGPGLRQLQAIKDVILQPDPNAPAITSNPWDDAEEIGSSVVEIYLKEYGLVETLDCLANCPDLLNISRDNVDEKFSLIEALLCDPGPPHSGRRVH